MFSYYSKAATIRRRLLFEGGYYSKAATIRSVASIQINMMLLVKLSMCVCVFVAFPDHVCLRKMCGCLTFSLSFSFREVFLG